MLYLAYGSNLLPARLAARCPSARSLGALALPGWRLAFHKAGSDGSAKCDLVPDAEATAHGALYELSDADRPVLDRIEGVGFGYEALHLELDGWGAAYVYRAQADFIDRSLVAFAWYHRFVVAGARHHRFPDSYVRELEQVPTRIDPDRERRAEARAILAGLEPG